MSQTVTDHLYTKGCRWRYYYHVDCETCGKRKSYWSYRPNPKPKKWDDRNEITYYNCSSHFV